MKTMAEVLTQHRDIAWNHETGRSICGGCDADLGPMNAYIEKQDEWLLTHQAAALAAAGYGPVKEAQAGAWAEGWQHYRAHYHPLDPEWGNNPYRAAAIEPEP